MHGREGPGVRRLGRRSRHRARRVRLGLGKNVPLRDKTEGTGKMGDWVSDLLIFSAGITGGVLINLVKPYFFMAKRRRTALVVARTQILSDIKHQHDEEILDEAFRTTEAIRGELDKSLRKLTKTLDTVLTPTDALPDERKFVYLTDPIKPSPTGS